MERGQSFNMRSIERVFTLHQKPELMPELSAWLIIQNRRIVDLLHISAPSALRSVRVT